MRGDLRVRLDINKKLAFPVVIGECISNLAPSDSVIVLRSLGRMLAFGHLFFRTGSGPLVSFGQSIRRYQK